MNPKNVSRATLGRLPLYLNELQTLRNEGKTAVSATILANRLNLGEVQVRKDLNAVCDAGRPRVGYDIDRLEESLKTLLGCDRISDAVIFGAGTLAHALLEYDGFAQFGIRVNCAFDPNGTEESIFAGKPVLPADGMKAYCEENRISLGVIATDRKDAKTACRLLCAAGIKAVWNLTGESLSVPETVVLKNENLALSLAHLNLKSTATE